MSSFNKLAALLVPLQLGPERALEPHSKAAERELEPAGVLARFGHLAQRGGHLLGGRDAGAGGYYLDAGHVAA